MPRSVIRPIRPLDSSTIDRIAAGEVIERPASVVKELVENALDAGARSLRITIEGGGLALISVEDDGHGIMPGDLPLAFDRHATSKIASAADIMQVESFGFRGEALASIASVSHCEMISRPEDESLGGMIAVSGGEIQSREPAPRNRGTTVSVRDLFFNTPARRKFLASSAAEKRAVVTMVTTLALAHPEVRWRLLADGDTLLDLLPVDSLPSRLRDLMGAELMKHMARFEKEQSGLSVGGLASRPSWTRGNRSQQFIYVNRRPIRNATLSQAIALAYRDVIPQGRFPVVMLFLQIPTGELDVNVHPAKTEVRLLLERRVFALIRSALQEGLSLRAHPIAGANPDGTVGEEGHSAEEGRTGALAGIARAEADFLRRHFQHGGARKEGGVEESRGQGELFSGTSRTGRTAPDPVQQAAFWQLHRTYILTQIRSGLVLIDQHNSHERILYNQAQQALAEGEGIPTQQLLFPAHLDLSPSQVQAFHSHQTELRGLGFLIQPFGGRTVLVQGIPSSLKNWTEGQLLLDMLDDLASHEQGHDSSRDALLASYACHGAVRAGELLNVREMQNLVDQLFATELPLSCPHGRPTMIEFSLADLEKRFGRR